MKINTSAGKPANKPKVQAFTLIEMIGVLAVIAILAALLIPKVFSAINDARVNGVCITCNTIKTAVADHYGKYGKFDAVFGTNILTFAGNILPGYDTNVLMAEGLLDKPFSAKIAGGDPSTNCVLQLSKNGGNGGSGYSLDGSTNTTVGASFVVEAVLYNVTRADARDLNDRLDGPPLGVATGADTKGRVEYADADPTTVYIYITHR
jgi:prepilin-type N-terminal cleavage/methylation domain-containing protein